MHWLLLEDDMVIEKPHFGVLEVHTTRFASSSSPSVSVVQLEFQSNYARDKFAENLIKEEDLGDVRVRRVFTAI